MFIRFDRIHERDGQTRVELWRGGLRRTCDLGVAGSRPGRDAAAQQP